MLEKNQVVWGDRIYKLKTRRDSIIDVYRDRYGQQALPQDRQYWTLCGQCTDENGRPHHNSEISQLVREDFITADQFHGVDLNDEITKYNRGAYPDSCWYTGEVYSVLCQVDEFNPGIINLDTVSNPRIAGRILSDTMSMLTDEPGEVMVVGNILMDFMNVKSRHSETNEILQALQESATFRRAWRSGAWKIHNQIYRYKPETGTEMASVIFFKK